MTYLQYALLILLGLTLLDLLETRLCLIPKQKSSF